MFFTIPMFCDILKISKLAEAQTTNVQDLIGRG